MVRWPVGLFISLAIAALFSVPLAFAATTPTSPAEPWLAGAKKSLGQKEQKSEFTSCFDYYRFGSTPTIISSDLTSVSQGSSISFSGTLMNENAYPITDMKIYAKIFHNRNPGVKDSFGPDIVDWFLIDNDIALKAGESYPFSTIWKVPTDATPGEYRIATFVVSHDRFNMAGLSFTNDIVGGNSIFHVVGGGVGNAHFDVTQTHVGDQELHAAAYAPRVPSSPDGVHVVTNIQNPSDQRFDGKVLWKLYAWDTVQEDSLIETKEEAVTIGPNNNVTLQYTVPNHSLSVYNLVGELVSENGEKSKSYVTVRFVSDAPAIPRINFAGTTSYPGVPGSEVFACIHSTGMKEAENVRLELTATSNSILDFLTGKGTLARKSYEGTAPGAIAAFAAPLSRASDSYTVRAKLYQNDVLIDDVSVPYECATFSDNCVSTRTINFLLGSALLILILGGVFMYRRRMTTQK